MLVRTRTKPVQRAYHGQYLCKYTKTVRTQAIQVHVQRTETKIARKSTCTIVQ